MMQAMRDRVKMIYWVVIVSFIGLMFLGWGIGQLNRPSQQAKSKGIVATVNGLAISEVAWRDRTRNILDQMRSRLSNDQNLSESQIMRARDQAYRELVDDTLQQQEARRLGITVTDEEIVDLLSNDPPPYLLASFQDEQGNVDYDAYYRALNDPSLPWTQVENQLRSSLPLQKLALRVSGEAVIGETELRQAFAEQNIRAVAEYIEVPFSDIELESDEVSDAEAEAYYQSHLDEYRQPERAAVRLLEFEKKASAADEAEVLSILEEIRQDIAEGSESFEEAARLYSEDSSASAGGDLGFFDRNRMVAPFTKAAFALKVGEISEPVKTQFGYHLIECTEEKLDDRGKRTEMRARHILLKLHPSQATIDLERESAYGAHDRAETAGIEAAAEQAGLELIETDPFQSGFSIPGVPSSLPGNAFAFSHDAGSLSPVFETDDTLYFFEVAQRLPAGHRSFEEVRGSVDSAVLNERRAESAEAKLAAALQKAGSDTPLKRIAAKAGLKYAVTDTFTLRENITDIGFATAFARAALSVEAQTLIPRVRTRRGVYALRTLYKSDFDEQKFAAARTQIASSLLFDRRRKILQTWMDALRAKAEIVDHRSDLL